MAKSYYKYQPHAAETQVNWAEISGNFSKILQEEVRVREEKRGAIDKASREFQNTLNTVEQGQAATANQWWLEGASQIQQQMLMQDRLLKSGDLKAKDYTIMRQNLTDGTDGLIGVFGAYNTELSERLERAEADESQDLEGFVMETMENFGNFQDTAIVINGETANMSVADIVGVKDGIIEHNPNSIRSINSLKGLIAQRYDKYDLDAATTKYADGVGVWDTFERTYGTAAYKGVIMQMSDPLNKGLTAKDLMALGLSSAQAADAEAQFSVYAAGEDNFVSKVMSNWSHVSSILTNTINVDDKNEQYTFTFAEERGDNEILLVQDAQGIVSAEYTPEQEEAVANRIRQDVRNKLDRKITKVTAVADYVQPSAATIASGSKSDAQKDIVGLWSQAYYKPLKGKQQVIDAIMSTDRAVAMGLKDLTITKDKISFSYMKGNEQFDINRPIKANPTREDWIQLGTEIHGLADIDESTIRAGRWPKEYEYVDFVNPDGTEFIVTSSRRGYDPVVDSKAVVMDNLQSLKLGATEDAWAKSIREATKGLNFVTEIPWNSKDKVYIYAPNDKEKASPFTVESGTTAEDVIAWIAQNVTKESADTYVNQQQAAGSGGGGASKYDKENQ